MGRPRLANGERGFTVNVYLTATEWLRFIEAARVRGVSKSAVIRELLASTPTQTV
jgi:hypothetical protein